MSSFSSASFLSCPLRGSALSSVWFDPVRRHIVCVVLGLEHRCAVDRLPSLDAGRVMWRVLKALSGNKDMFFSFSTAGKWGSEWFCGITVGGVDDNGKCDAVSIVFVTEIAKIDMVAELRWR